ncbi:MAG: hypothetical protein RLZZ584_694 [Pseudomonadota bacterium]
MREPTQPAEQRRPARGWLPRLLLVALVAGGSLAGCGYNSFQTGDEEVKAGWAEVFNQYQRRTDLVPNLVSTVKAEAKFEQDTLTRVVHARLRATSIQATQGELTGALSRLLVVAESYPALRANQGFRDLSARLEGTENRINVAWRRDIQAVQGLVRPERRQTRGGTSSQFGVLFPQLVALALEVIVDGGELECVQLLAVFVEVLGDGFHGTSYTGLYEELCRKSL